MDLEKAKEIVKGRLQFGNPEHIEAVNTVEQDYREEAAAAWAGFDVEIQIDQDAVTGIRRTRMSAPEEPSV